ncbi:MAG TPA: hypothetical protein VIJ12_01440 [Candidatus Baltobacteraceae bacterium]
MGALIFLGIFAIPALLLYVILKLRQRRERGEEDYGGTYDRAPLNPVPLREYTGTGSIDLKNPPPGYTSDDIPRD